ncbi:MAG: threonine aldolase, partial [Ilumatobacteraceae bacterium]
FVAAQFNALLEADLWLELAAHSNSMGIKLWEATRAIPSVTLGDPPAVNSVFPCLPADSVVPLQEWCFFWDWDVTRSQVRWMTAWDTTIEDVEQFAAGIRHLLA